MSERERLIEISAAWEVWGDAMHAIRRAAQMAQWSGDMPDAAQIRDARAQVELQIREAYARARVQCAIAFGVDGVDTAPAFDQHWRETWGDTIANSAAEQWRTEHAAALARQTAAREGAAAQNQALEAVGSSAP